MKYCCAVVLLLGVWLHAPRAAASNSIETPQASFPAQAASLARASAALASPALTRIAEARAEIKKDPNRFQGHNDLALALVRRARETSDPAYYQEAEQNVNAGLRLAPDNFQLLKTQVEILLGRHEFVEAREKAQILNHRTPDDVVVYGYIADADIALGNYPEAETAVQWMLNIRPDNIPGLLVGARLRAVYGDPEGALDFLNQAYGETSPNEVEELAWIANHIADVQIGMGKTDDADRVLQQAQTLFPNYPNTQRNLATLRLAQGRDAEAVELLRQNKAPRAEELYLLAEAFEGLGKIDQAKAAYADFVTAARQRMNAPANDNRELILYYADHGMPEQSMSIAQQRIGMRQDVGTLDAFAWALYANGQFAEAAGEIEKALTVGVRDPRIFYHAANIALKSGNDPEASRYFRSAVEVDPASPYAAPSLQAMAALPSGSHRGQKAVEVSTGAKLPLATLPPKPLMTPRPALLNAAFLAKPLQPVPAAWLIPQTTATDRAIRSAQSQVVRSPNEAAAYANLGGAYFQKARETWDVTNYELAEKSLTKSLDLVSNDLSATVPYVTLAEVCMGEHRFAEALVYAQKAMALGSGDLSAFGIVGDAYTDMGDYDKGADAYSKLQLPGVQMLAGSAYIRESRISYLKFISGKTNDAIALMQAAVAEGTEVQLPRENLAWLYVELGEDYFRAGEVGSADGAYFTALTIHPGDFRALAGLGKARAAEGRYTEAIVFYKSAVAVVPMPLYVAELGDLYAKTGDTADANKAYALVEYIGMLGHINRVLHNRDLALFYADHDKNLPESLVLAKKEFEVRQDVYTWDALAWALYKNGKPQEANDAINKAMRYHTQDALLYFHAGMIQQSLGRRDKEREYLSEALKINPEFHVFYADMARQQLAGSEMHAAQAAERKAGNVQ